MQISWPFFHNYEYVFFTILLLKLLSSAIHTAQKEPIVVLKNYELQNVAIVNFMILGMSYSNVFYQKRSSKRMQMLTLLFFFF